MNQPLITRPGYGEEHNPALPTASSKEPSKAQLDYAKRLVSQVGGAEPDWSKMDSVEVSNLIDGLKTKRGKPVWYGNGQFSHWEKKDAQSGLPSLPQSNIPDHPPNVMAVAELPSGGPSDRGLPVDDGLPGSRTFAKPEDDIRKSDPKDEPIKRVDGPDNIPKDRDRVDTKEDNKNIGPPSYSPSESWDSTSKTPYPYRDDKSNTHNAMAIRVARRYEAPEVVAGMYLVASAPVLFLPGESKIAADLPEIEERLSPEIQTKGKACRASLKRADLKNLRWIFAVNCGNGPKVVRLKANRSGNVVQFPKLNLHLACSCPAWRWQGPEYHAKQQDYQDPNTPFQGTASAPNIRDPKRVHKVCKHVAAVLSMTRNWTLPARSGK